MKDKENKTDTYRSDYTARVGFAAFMFIMALFVLMGCILVYAGQLDGVTLSSTSNKVVTIFLGIAGAFLTGVWGYKLVGRLMRLSKRLENKDDGKIQHLKKAPGSTLLIFVEYFYSPKMVNEVFKPIVADWRNEYFDALRDGNKSKASWISARYIISFCMAMGLSKVFSVIRSIAHR
jgi:hypothetical protein